MHLRTQIPGNNRQGREALQITQHQHQGKKRTHKGHAPSCILGAQFSYQQSCLLICLQFYIVELSEPELQNILE